MGAAQGVCACTAALKTRTRLTPARPQIYIKIDLQDVKEPSIEVTPEGVFKFSGRVTQAKVERVYTADVRLFAPLDVKVRHARCAPRPTFLFSRADEKKLIFFFLLSLSAV